MAIAIKLSTEIKTSAFCYQLLFIHDYRRMTITLYGLDTAGRNWFMDLDYGIDNYLSLYHNIAVQSVWLSLEAEYFCLNIQEKELFWFVIE